MQVTCDMCGTAFETRAPRKRTCPACSAACVICGAKHKALGLCSAHHMQWLQASKPDLPAFVHAVRAGEPIGRVRRVCIVCGEEFSPYGPEKTCSDQCATQHRRRLQRESKRREWERNRDKLVARQRARYHSAAGQEAAKRQHKARHQKTMADPERHAKVRQQSRETYRRNREEILARRKERIRAKLQEMTAEELAAYAERQREYTRRWRRRLKQDVNRHEANRRSQRRWRAARQRMRVADDLLAVLAAAANPPPPRPCEICGQPILGRRPGAHTCGPVCDKVRRSQLRAAKRPEKTYICEVCGKPFVRQTSTVTCSPECRAERRKQTKHQNRSKQNGRS